MKQHVRSKHTVNQAKCKSCDQVFPKNSELEIHIELNHREVEKFSCDECDMTFVLLWRLKKHKSIHSENNNSYCHYFNNDKACPYARLGCMFKHESSPACIDIKNCSRRLCQFKHRNPTHIEAKSCELCQFVGTSDENLESHVKNLHTEKAIELTEDEQYFDLYVQHNFDEVYNDFMGRKSRIKCYYCQYLSKSQILYHIQGEIGDHLKSEHGEVIKSYDPDTYTFDNDQHEDFLAFFVQL